MSSEVSDYWQVKCSNENLTNIPDEWEPSVEEIEKIYTLIDNNGPYQLDWQSPGYRSPSPAAPTTPDPKDSSENVQNQEKVDNYDFMDEMSSPSIRVRREGEIGSAKKKTASLDGVLSIMRRHWQLQQMQKESTNSNPPSTESKPT